jgi:hypothetical protein
MDGGDRPTYLAKSQDAAGVVPRVGNFPYPWPVVIAAGSVPTPEPILQICRIARLDRRPRLGAVEPSIAGKNRVKFKAEATIRFWPISPAHIEIKLALFMDLNNGFPRLLDN